jgi:hypothetical protein
MDRQNLINRLVARKLQSSNNDKALCWQGASRKALCWPAAQPKK